MVSYFRTAICAAALIGCSRPHESHDVEEIVSYLDSDTAGVLSSSQIGVTCTGDEGFYLRERKTIACWRIVGDSVSYSYTTANSGALVRGRRYPVDPLRLISFADSLRNALSTRFALRFNCIAGKHAKDDPTAIVFDYWHDGGRTLFPRAAALMGRGTTQVQVESALGRLSCREWIGSQPLRM